MSANDYKITVGIECHVQLNTKTKLFSAVDNDAVDSGSRKMRPRRPCDEL